MNKTKAFLASTVALLLLLAVTPSAFAATEDNSTGTATVLGVAPSISSPELWNLAEDTDGNNTALTVDTEYHVNATIADSNTMADLDNVTFVIYEDTNADWDSADSQRFHYTFSWTESTDTWAEEGPESPDHIIAANCSDPGTASGASSYEFRLAWKSDKVAAHMGDTTKWIVNITVTDDSANSDNDTSLVHDFAYYAEISISDSTHAWSGLSPGDTNEVVDGDGDIDFTVISNANWDAQAKANQSNLISGSNTIAVGNITIHYDTEGSSAALTTGYLDIGGITGQSPPTDDDSPTSTYCKLWLDVPATQAAGDYTYDLEIQIVEA